MVEELEYIIYDSDDENLEEFTTGISLNNVKTSGIYNLPVKRVKVYNNVNLECSLDYIVGKGKKDFNIAPIIIIVNIIFSILSLLRYFFF